MTPKKTFTFHISDEMKAALESIRVRDGLSEAEQIRRGVQMWLNSRAVKKKKTGRERAVTRTRP